jgi:DNA-binding SARP family transcriptional activator
VGADDELAIVSSALTVAAAIGADVQLLEGMEHALAEEPGIDPAPQTEVAKRVDPIAAEWLREHLTQIAPPHRSGVSSTSWASSVSST